MSVDIKGFDGGRRKNIFLKGVSSKLSTFGAHSCPVGRQHRPGSGNQKPKKEKDVGMEVMGKNTLSESPREWNAAFKWGRKEPGGREAKA